ncbi:hypothetical protein ACIBCA_01375 [Kitasatospora sp. NPDC051170]|uniref:hypothetical protein n=1 Tax=Kitasatospora sp. NPDC051170 TaxID=3364056 RepID=UPI0037B1F559
MSVMFAGHDSGGVGWTTTGPRSSWPPPHLGYLPGELRLYPELTGAQTLRLLGDLQGTATTRRAELCERLALMPGLDEAFLSSATLAVVGGVAHRK